MTILPCLLVPSIHSLWEKLTLFLGKQAVFVPRTAFFPDDRALNGESSGTIGKDVSSYGMKATRGGIFGWDSGQTKTLWKEERLWRVR